MKINQHNKEGHREGYWEIHWRYGDIWYKEYHLVD